MSNNTRLLNDLKSYYHNEFITLPKDIFFLYNPGEKVQMFLNFSTVYSDNMQTSIIIETMDDVFDLICCSFNLFCVFSSTLSID